MIRSRSPITQRFCYIDTCTYIADRLFNEAGVKVTKTDILHRPGEDFRVVVAKCRKKDLPEVVEVLNLLPSKALVCGWFDYMAYANWFMKETKFNTEEDENEQ